MANFDRIGNSHHQRYLRKKMEARLQREAAAETEKCETVKPELAKANTITYNPGIFDFRTSPALVKTADNTEREETVDDTPETEEIDNDTKPDGNGTNGNGTNGTTLTLPNANVVVSGVVTSKFHQIGGHGSNQPTSPDDICAFIFRKLYEIYSDKIKSNPGYMSTIQNKIKQLGIGEPGTEVTLYDNGMLYIKKEVNRPTAPETYHNITQEYLYDINSDFIMESNQTSYAKDEETLGVSQGTVMYTNHVKYNRDGSWVSDKMLYYPKDPTYQYYEGFIWKFRSTRDNNATWVKYYEDGSVYEGEDPNGNCVAIAHLATDVKFDSMGHIIGYTDLMGNVWKFDKNKGWYTDDGLKLYTHFHPDHENRKLCYTAICYNSDGSINWATDPNYNPVSLVGATNIKFNSNHDMVIGYTDSNGVNWTFEYGAWHRAA